jgi:hypothetical protein
MTGGVADLPGRDLYLPFSCEAVPHRDAWCKQRIHIVKTEMVHLCCTDYTEVHRS